MTEITLPAGLRAEHTIIQPNVNGATLVMGVERITVGDPDAAMRVPVSVAIEWVASIHLPPAALKRLQQQLNEVVGNYEARFGPIPQDLPTPPRPALAIFNPEVVRDRPEAPQTEAQPGEQGGVTLGAPFDFRWPPWNRAVQQRPPTEASGQTTPQDHRPPSSECPPDEPAPSPSEPTP